MAMNEKSRRDIPEELRAQARQRRDRSMDEDLFDGDSATTINESGPLKVTTGELTDVVAAIRDADVAGEPTDEKLVPNINEMADRGVNATPARGPAAQDEPADRGEIETNDVEMAQANQSADRTKGAVEEKGASSGSGSVDENVPGEMTDETTIFMASAFMASGCPIEGEMPEAERRGKASRVRAHRNERIGSRGHAAKRKGHLRR